MFSSSFGMALSDCTLDVSFKGARGKHQSTDLDLFAINLEVLGKPGKVP